jgi:hypothetical protein
MTTTATKTRRPAKTAAPRKSIEEKKAQAAALHESIATQVEALRDSDRWTAFLAFASAFHAYSLNNVLLILSQRPDAERVAGFRKWQGLGRQVRKGEKAVRIFGYSTKKVTEEDENGESQEKRIARFPILSVFDIAQTDVIEGETDRTIARQLTGADDHGIVDTLSAYLEAAGWTVERQDLTGGRNGYSDPEGQRVVIGTHLSPEHAAKTMIHETAHVLMGHTGDLAEYAEHRGLMETEAESVAYVVAGLVGCSPRRHPQRIGCLMSDLTSLASPPSSSQDAGVLRPYPRRSSWRVAKNRPAVRQSQSRSSGMMDSRCGSVRPTGRVLNCQIGTRHSPAMSTAISRSSRTAASISSIVRRRNVAASSREDVSAAAVSHHSMALSSSEPRATEASDSASSCSVTAPEDTRKARFGSPDGGGRTGSRLRVNARRPSRRYSVSAPRSRSILTSSRDL